MTYGITIALDSVNKTSHERSRTLLSWGLPKKKKTGPYVREKERENI